MVNDKISVNCSQISHYRTASAMRLLSFLRSVDRRPIRYDGSRPLQKTVPTELSNNNLLSSAAALPRARHTSFMIWRGNEGDGYCFFIYVYIYIHRLNLCSMQCAAFYRCKLSSILSLYTCQWLCKKLNLLLCRVNYWSWFCREQRISDWGSKFWYST